MAAFAGVLQDEDILKTTRKTHRDDIDAARGNLAGEVGDRTDARRRVARRVIGIAPPLAQSARPCDVSD